VRLVVWSLDEQFVFLTLGKVLAPCLGFMLMSLFKLWLSKFWSVIRVCEISRDYRKKSRRKTKNRDYLFLRSSDFWGLSFLVFRYWETSILCLKVPIEIVGLAKLLTVKPTQSKKTLRRINFLYWECALLSVSRDLSTVSSETVRHFLLRVRLVVCL
jgi:hypothetical protein